MKPEIRPTTAEDVLEFYGQPSRYSMRAYSIFWKGELKAIAGVTREPNCFIFFSDSRDHDAPKLTVWRVSREIVNRVKEMGLPVRCAANPEKKNSTRFLESLGFVYIGDSDGERIYELE